MRRSSNNVMKLPLGLMLLGIAFWICGCWSFTHYRNYEGTKPRSEIATVSHRGYELWLADDQEDRYEELRLTPGKYIIGFRESHSGIGGAGSCELEAGQMYDVRIVGRTILPESKLVAFVIECFPTGPIPDDFQDQDS